VTVVLLVEAAMTIGLGSYLAIAYRHRWREWIHRPWRASWRARSAARSARRGATESQFDRGPRSALSLGRFSVVSVVALEGTAIVACRPRPAATRHWFGRRLWLLRRARSRSPRLVVSDQMLVLRVADPAEAERAWALLEQWRRSGTVLWLRPTALPSTVKLSDDGRSTLQAVLSSE
jgi:hypothetical protein